MLLVVQISVSNQRGKHYTTLIKRKDADTSICANLFSLSLWNLVCRTEGGTVHLYHFPLSLLIPRSGHPPYLPQLPPHPSAWFPCPVPCCNQPNRIGQRPTNRLMALLDLHQPTRVPTTAPKNSRRRGRLVRKMGAWRIDECLVGIGGGRRFAKGLLILFFLSRLYPLFIEEE